MLSAFFFGMGNVLWSELDGKHKLYFYYFFYKIPAFEDFNQFLVSCIHKNVFELCKKPPDQKDSNIFLNNAKLRNCFICTDAFVYLYAVGALHLFDGTNHGFKQCQLNRCIN